MGRNPTGQRKYQIEQIWDTHHEIMRLLLIGMKEVDIARHLGVSPVMVSYTKNSAIVQRQMSLLQAARDAKSVDIGAEIKKLLPKAVRVLEECMDSELPNIKLSAAKDALDRGGHGAVRKIDVRETHHFSTDEIREIRERAKEIGILSPSLIPEVIDAEYNT